MRALPTIIRRLLAVGLVGLSLANCSSEPPFVLDSDVPNVSGFDPIVTRNIQHSGSTLSSVEVIYRGDVVDTRVNVEATRQRFADAGWALVSTQARGDSTLLNFTKDSRAAQVEVAINQIDPMMSPAILRVQPAADGNPRNSSAPTVQSAGAVPSSTGNPTRSGGTFLEGFAPPPVKR